MLKVNLLPPEKKKLKRTPLIILGPLLLSILLAFGSLGMDAWWFFEWQDLEDKIKTTEADLASREPQLRQWEELKAKIKKIDDDMKSINEIAKRTHYWGEILHAVFEVVSKNQRIYLDEIQHLDASRASSAIPGMASRTPQDKPMVGLDLKCNALTEIDPKTNKPIMDGAMAAMSKFRKDLREHPLLRDKLPMLFPQAPIIEMRMEGGTARGTFRVVLGGK